jgi:dCTP diphosphatase
MSDVINVDELKKNIEAFAKVRDWEQFHTPKNLACALNVEASELLEVFQWMSVDEQKNISDEKKEAVAEELSDILTYAIRLAGVLDINLSRSIEKKIEKNAKKYPAELVRGSSKKYDEY